ncbi:SDR family oxidoreductase [Marinilactibacillus sp. Marseille-P9653]|uniref:SDR family oxidoreductase n=1 Tax=Marinilactibacillus sp. Marseille-P9653 TaxID=2866583 RepID=UPI001CE453D5|nr:SDR family oxidoreductase [Marinilactibacillus sp. Marseille-P9653]
MTEENIVKTQEPKKDYLMDDESENMRREPVVENEEYKSADKLKDKVAIITGGDSGIGAATAILFAKEGAKVAFTYHSSDDDAEKTKNRLQEIGADVLVFKGDVGDEKHAAEVTQEVVSKWGSIDILVNHAGEQMYQESILDITAEQVDRTYRTNIFSMIYFVKAVFPHMNEGGKIINTSSVTAYKGNPNLLDYSGTNGAIVSFTRSLSQNQEFTNKKIRVNTVAPGPIWTPLIPATFPEEEIASWGKDGALGRPGEAYELAPAYVFLASDDSSYVTGQTIHVNGGVIVNG